MEGYKTLISALCIFSEEFDLDRVQNLGSLEMSIENDHINFEELKSEYSKALKGKNFDWVQLSNHSSLLYESNMYTRDEMRNYIKFLIHDFVFPESKLSQDELNKLVEICMKNLSDLEEGEWMDSVKLWEKIKNAFGYRYLEYYQLYHAWPNSNYRIERKFVEGKEVLIGSLRVKANDHISY